MSASSFREYSALKSYPVTLRCYQPSVYRVLEENYNISPSRNRSESLEGLLPAATVRFARKTHICDRVLDQLPIILSAERRRPFPLLFA